MCSGNIIIATEMIRVVRINYLLGILQSRILYTLFSGRQHCFGASEWSNRTHQRFSLDQLSILRNVEILARRGITSYIEEESYLPICTLLGDSVTGWSYWNDIRDFSRKTGIPIEEICCKLNFSVFDE